MGLLSLFKRQPETRASVPQNFSPYLASVTASLGNPMTDAGVDVTPMRAMQSAAVWACIRTIAETVAGLPFHVYKDTDGVKVRDRKHPVYRLVHDQPNEWMSSFTLRDQMLTQLLLHGNAYAVVERDPATERPVAILPLESSSVSVYRQNGGLFYVTSAGDIITPDNMIHVMGFTLNGVVGLSPIMQQKAAIGLAIATEQFGAAFFKNGGHLSGIFERTGVVSPEAAKAFKEEWTKFYNGLGNAHGTPLLPQGVAYKSLTIPPDSAQFLETRKYERADIAAVFRCPPFVVGDHEHSTFSNLESQGRQIVMYTLAPWIQRLEAEFSRKLFREDEQGVYSVKLNVDGLQRGDTAARQAFYANGRQWGYLNVDDIRALEDLPPLPDGAGQTYLQPTNMAPVGSPPTAPAPAQRGLPDPRPILEDAARRLLVKEAKAVTRAAKKYQGKSDELRQWADQWYVTHQALVARVFTPAIKAANLNTDAGQYAERHVAESKQAIIRAIDNGTDAADLSDEFTDIRPADIADSLINGAHHGN